MPDLPRLSRLQDVAGLVERLPAFHEAAAIAARDRQRTLTKPPGSLGRLEDLAVFLAGWRRTVRPRIERAQVLIFAGNHGVCAQGVSPFPQDVTAQMVANFRAGGAAINQLAMAAGAELTVVPLALERPTADFTEAPAMTETECLAAMNEGAAVVAADSDVVAVGEMGIGNSTVAAALACAVFGGDAAAWTGQGTGATGEMLSRKTAAVAAGVARHRGVPPLDLLAALGGREQAAICGAVLGARARSVPVVLDGYICTAAVAPLYAAAPRLLDHCLAGHVSAEAGHAALLERMGLRPLLDLGMRLGEGTGAALAIGVLRAALACHDGMATFAEAGVSDK